MVHSDFGKGSIWQYFNFKNFKDELLGIIHFFFVRTRSKGLRKNFVYKNARTWSNFLLLNPCLGLHHKWMRINNPCYSLSQSCLHLELEFLRNNYIFWFFTLANRLCIRRAPSCRQRAKHHILSSPPDRRTTCSLLQQMAGCYQGDFKIGAEIRMASCSRRGMR